jgi:hypothetical protein
MHSFGVALAAIGFVSACLAATKAQTSYMAAVEYFPASYKDPWALSTRFASDYLIFDEPVPSDIQLDYIEAQLLFCVAASIATIGFALIGQWFLALFAVGGAVLSGKWLYSMRATYRTLKRSVRGE